MPKIKNYHFHLPFLKFDSNGNLKYLYALITVRNLSNKLTMFFLPLFLFDLGKSLNFSFLASLSEFQRGILLIAFTYFLIRFLTVILSIPIAQIISKIGLERGLSVGAILYTLMTLALFFATKNPLFIFVVSVIDGFQIPFFWSSYHTIFSRNALKSNVGKDLGFVNTLINLVAMVSPAIGGMIITTFGFQALFIVGLGISLIAIFFTFKMKNEKIKDEVSFKEFSAWIGEKRYKRLALSFFGKYINDATLVVWPLYVMILLGSVEKVGFLYTTSIFLAMILSFFIGSYLDKVKKARKPFLLSGGMLAALWFVRTQIISVWTIAVVDMLDKLTSNFHWLFFNRLWMIRSKGSQALSFFVYRELLLSICAVVFWWVFASFFIAFPLGWQGLFVFAALGVMLSLLIKG